MILRTKTNEKCKQGDKFYIIVILSLNVLVFKSVWTDKVILSDEVHSDRY